MSQASINLDNQESVLELFECYEDDYSSDIALMKALGKSLRSSDFKRLALQAVDAPEKKPFAEKPRVIDGIIRKAIVLDPTEFCVLYDENGEPKAHEGPGRVFPGPYDTIRSDGSRNGVYDAYHVRPDRGILLRIVAKFVVKDDLHKRLPKGVDGIEKKAYQKGDELFIGGIDAYVVPHASFEVIDPNTRQPHIGNDHRNVYVQSIGVDQKSGVYVAEVETGNVELVKGKKKLLLDPRKKTHIKRIIPGYMWNQMIAHVEPHKRVGDSSSVKTPWAVSVRVPNNEVILITSRDGRWPVMGPCIELLEYEENLEVMTLSQGRPKSDNRLLETCFLRVEGNRITDQVTVETADKVRIQIDVEYGVTFVAENDDDMVKWFNFKNYVMLLSNNTRSRLRGFAKTFALVELDKNISNFVRDTILGVKGEEDEHRPGLLFPENNMKVTEVEVIDYQILDESISDALQKANKSIVTRVVEDLEKESVLSSEKRRSIITDEMDKIKIENAERESVVAQVIADSNQKNILHLEKLAHEANQASQKNAHVEDMTRQDNLNAVTAVEQERLDEMSLRELERKIAEHSKNIELNKERREAIIKFRIQLSKIQKAITMTDADAQVKKLAAVQPHLIKALEGIGDKQVLTAFAENLPEATGAFGFLAEAGGIKALKSMVSGTRMEGLFDSLAVTTTELEAGDENSEKNAGGDNEEK